MAKEEAPQAGGAGTAAGEPSGEAQQPTSAGRPPPRRSGRTSGAGQQATPAAPGKGGSTGKPPASGKKAPTSAPTKPKPAQGGASTKKQQRSQSETPAPSKAAASTASKGSAGKAGREVSAGAGAKRSRLAPEGQDAKGKGKSKASPAAAAAASGQKRARGSYEDPSGRMLRGRGGVSFKEGDEEEEEEEEEGDSAEEGAASEEEEPEVDNTIYTPPPGAALPGEVVVLEGPSGAKLSVPTDAIGELLAAWNVLRAFSWQLRLSPFAFRDFCAAMASPLPTALMDEVHVCVLRALAADETPAERAEHALDISLLDAMTWPQYVWELLRLTEDPLSEHEWAHRVRRAAPEGDTAAVAGPSSRRAASSGEQPRGASPGVPQAFSPLPDKAAMDAALAATSGSGSSSSGAAQQAHSLREVLSEGSAPQQPAAAPDYYALPLGIKAEILSRLCDHLLDCVTIRAEIDRREREGQVVSGTGGQGGAYPILTPEQRKRAEKKAQTDANTDCCVLCGQGGNLICCDGCPAAYHMRCLGQNTKSLGEGDWMCPECAAGGRGEAAGLRIPPAARGKHRQPYYAMHGMLVRAGVPTVRSRGRHAQELEDSVPMMVYLGNEAAAELKQAQRVRAADELPHPSSLDALKDPPPLKAEGGEDQEGIDLLAGAMGYLNRYRSSWGAAAAARNAAVEECKRAKGKKGSYIPTGTTGFLSVPELPALLTLSRFQWVQLQGKSARQAVRCGKCHTCANPTLRKGCLNPIVKGGEDAPADNSKLGFLIALASKVEREFWQLLEGPWGEPGGRGMAHKNAWVAAVRSAASVEQLSKAVLELEAALRPVALAPEWKAERGAGTGGRTPAASRAVSRAASTADLAALGAGGEGDVAVEVESEAAVAAVAGPPDPRGTADPYDLKSDNQVLRAGWEMNRRSHSAHITGVNRLPRALLRKAARQAGWQPIPGVRFRRFRWTLGGPRMQWITAMESARTAAQLAIGLRQLDAVLQWDTASKPKSEGDTPFYQASLLGKRPAQDEGGGFEYLLQMQPPPTPNPLQQQALALAMQQRAMLGAGPAQGQLWPGSQQQQQQQAAGGQQRASALRALASAGSQHQRLGSLGLGLSSAGLGLGLGRPRGGLGGTPSPLLSGAKLPPLPPGAASIPALQGRQPSKSASPRAGQQQQQQQPQQGDDGAAAPMELDGTAHQQQPQPRQPEQEQEGWGGAAGDVRRGGAAAAPVAPRPAAGVRWDLAGSGSSGSSSSSSGSSSSEDEWERSSAGEEARGEQEEEERSGGRLRPGAYDSEGESDSDSDLSEGAGPRRPYGRAPRGSDSESDSDSSSSDKDYPDEESFGEEGLGPGRFRLRGRGLSSTPGPASEGDQGAGSSQQLPRSSRREGSQSQQEQQAGAQGGAMEAEGRVAAAGGDLSPAGARDVPAEPMQLDEPAEQQQQLEQAQQQAEAAGTEAACPPQGSGGVDGGQQGHAIAGTLPAAASPTSQAAAAAKEEEEQEGSKSEGEQPSQSQAAGPKKRGGKVRRCGVCKNCLNPAGKQVCLQLKVKREEDAAARQEELARRYAEELLKLDDPDHVARVVTAAAFAAALAAAGEEELRSPDAPAAMAAKLRARLTSIAAGASPPVPAKSGSPQKSGKKSAKKGVRELGGLATWPSAGKLAALAEVKQALGPTVQLPGGAALPLRVAMSSHEPAWVHERHLPLWLIKAYEEKIRREEANAAARQAAAAARSTQLTGAGDKDAARIAARAAAAAAADACGVCGALHGEEPALDGIWICCDFCNRWFHGACAGASQEDVDALGDGAPWACPGCWDNNRRRERAARRQQRQPFDPSKLPPLPPVSASEEQQTEGKKRGRPPKPFWQKADYQRKEQQALDRIRRQQHREAVAAALRSGEPPPEREHGFKRKRKGEQAEAQQQPEGEEQEEQQLLGEGQEARPKAERWPKRKREEGGELEQEPEEPVYCPLCKLPDYGRDLVQCDTCEQWMHPECAGVSMEEVEAEPQWVCAGCQGKRMRAPSQAAVQAAIAAARERMEEEEAGEGRRAAKRARLAGARGQRSSGAAAGQLDGGWASAALQVLLKVERLSSAEDFLRPVPRDTPGYRAVIRQPMDLGTVKRRLAKGKYARPEELLADTRLIWSNCRTFNEEGSEIVEAADATQRALERRWEREGLPLPPEQLAPAQQQQEEEEEEAQQQQQQPLEGGVPEVKQEEELSQPADEPGPSAGVLQPEAKRSRADKAPPGQQQQQQAAGEAAEAGGEAAAAAPGGKRVRHKSVRLAEADEDTLGADLPPAAAQQQQQRASRPSSSKRARQASAADWPIRAAKVLQAVMQIKEAESFTMPVPRSYPGYHEVITRPMDLGTVSRRLQKGKYAHPDHLLADVQLVWSNCRDFNDETAPIIEACDASEAAFNQLWAAAGIYGGPAAEGGPAGGGQPAAAGERERTKHRPPFDWKAAARAVLYRVQLQKPAAWFMEAVSPEDAPDYAQVIDKPMDFGIISRKLLADQYASPYDLLDDCQLVWDNCRNYNGPPEESPITADCEATRAVFEAAWAEKGLAGVAPLDPAAAPVAREAWARAAAAGASSPGVGPAEAPGAAAPSGRSGRSSRAVAGGGRQAAQQPEAAAGGRGSSRARSALAPAPVAADWVAAAKQVLKRVLRLPDSQVFATPVTPEMLLDYHQVVARPMDLGTVQQKLAAGEYASPQAMARDVQLIWDNCWAYNQPGDAVWQMGEAVRAAFDKHWSAAGLPVLEEAAAARVEGGAAAAAAAEGGAATAAAAAAQASGAALPITEPPEPQPLPPPDGSRRPPGGSRRKSAAPVATTVAEALPAMEEGAPAADTAIGTERLADAAPEPGGSGRHSSSGGASDPESMEEDDAHAAMELGTGLPQL